jgi:hypothetical protein
MSRCRKLAQSVVEGTLAMLVNGGALLEELSRLAALEQLPSIVNNYIRHFEDFWLDVLHHSLCPLAGNVGRRSHKGAKTVVEDIEPEILEVADIVIDYGRQKFHHPRTRGW